MFVNNVFIFFFYKSIIYDDEMNCILSVADADGIEKNNDICDKLIFDMEMESR